MQAIFSQLYRGEPISRSQSEQLFRAPIQDDIAGAVSALLADAKYFPRPYYTFADIVGTGGDGSNSINISTASAIVAAGCGARVAKHGNCSISSSYGSFDLLAAFGIRLNMQAEQSRKALDELGLCFLFAPQYHSNLHHAMLLRKKLKTRTLFNVLGPLINPARPPLTLIGVYSPELVLPIASTLRVLGYQRAAVVHGGGMDEVALHAPTQVAELRDGIIDTYALHPADFGLQVQPAEALRGGSQEENRDRIARLLQGKGEHAHASAVAANVALLLKLFGKEDIRENTHRALYEIQSGQSYTRLMALAIGT